MPTWPCGRLCNRRKVPCRPRPVVKAGQAQLWLWPRTTCALSCSPFWGLASTTAPCLPSQLGFASLLKASCASSSSTFCFLCGVWTASSTTSVLFTLAVGQQRRPWSWFPTSLRPRWWAGQRKTLRSRDRSSSQVIAKTSHGRMRGCWHRTASAGIPTLVHRIIEHDTTPTQGCRSSIHACRDMISLNFSLQRRLDGRFAGCRHVIRGPARPRARRPIFL
mmetsp:Transcript_126679/g.300997  ORF Transcript_126679/g.300997 Transcript_126679/m.300997 type:complete len:220 (+) Transcript_126679:467-1126(+)